MFGKKKNPILFSIKLGYNPAVFSKEASLLQHLFVEKSNLNFN